MPGAMSFKSRQCLLSFRLAAHRFNDEGILMPLMLLGLLSVMPFQGGMPPSVTPSSLEVPNPQQAARELSKFVYHRTRQAVPASYHLHSWDIAKAILDASQRYQIDPIILMSVIHNESSFNPKAIGRHGEIGLMQIRPGTALWMISTAGIDSPSEAAELTDHKKVIEALYDPATNIMLGAAYLSHMKQKFAGQGNLYLAAYNMGPRNVVNLVRQGKEPRRYSDRVLKAHASFKQDLAEHRRLIQTTASTFDLR